MAELNLKQITDKLNAEFASDVRKLVFWYDTNAEFISDIDTIELKNAKVLKLERDNQFRTKYFLERKDTETNYLIYAPFPKPALRENHLADTIRYSKEFFADRASLLAIDLGIDDKYKPVLQHYIKFFGAKDRTQKFYDLEIENFNKQIIETAIMSVICKVKIVSFEEIVRTVITDDDLKNNKYLSEFEKYDLLVPFWKMCEENFGYTDVAPSLSKFIYTLFVTYTSKVIHSELPQAWKNYCSHKSGNIIAFLDSLMNSMIYSEDFDKLSQMVYDTLKGDVIITRNGREVARLTTVDYQQGRANYMDAAVREEVAEYLFNNRKATYEEFMELSKDSQYRYEYIDGEIYLLASPRTSHQVAMTKLFGILINWFEGKKCIPIAAPYDLTLWRDTDKNRMDDELDTKSESESDVQSSVKPSIVQPDLMVICDLEEKLNDNDYYIGVPALVIEIVSESTQSRDYVKKLDLYMSCGVQEYWIVNPLNKSITIFQFKDMDIHDNVTYKKSEIAQSYIFDGLAVEVDKVFM
jgi:Uma2 family endonuclease